jgi:hypothetical protein
MYLPSSRQSSVRQRQKGFTGKLPGIMAIKKVRTLLDPQIEWKREWSRHRESNGMREQHPKQHVEPSLNPMAWK